MKVDKGLEIKERTCTRSYA